MAGLIIPFKGMRPRIAADAFIAPTATVIGDVEIGSGASIWFGCVLRGDVNPIRVGRNTNLQDGTIVHVNGERENRPGMPTHIGNGVVVGHAALIHACTLEDGAFVGMRATVMDLAVVEGGAMVAGGAVVTPGKTVKAGELWAGYPARLMRKLTEAELADIPYLAEHYRKLGAHYLREVG
jgi:carbonic anhydrase/acetyltransferase-like protein (isoleucine patch superfamily)